MIGSQHDWLQMPTLDLYDTQLMLAAINTAKDMYEKGEERLKNFYKEYGDFSTPFEKDMARYGEIVDSVLNGLDEIYNAGDDPIRSASGRAKMARLINRINPAEMSKMRTNAKLGFEYLKNIEEAKAKDQFSQEFEDYLLTHGGPGLFKEFSSKKGVWGRPGPGRYLTVDELLEPIVKNVDYTFDEAMTKAHNDGHDYYSITKDRLMKAVDDNMSDILATQSGGFHYWKAMKAAKALGGDEEMGKEIFRTMISNRLSDHEKTKKEVNQFALDDHRTANDMKAAWSSQAAQAHYNMIENGADEDGDGKLSKQERMNYATRGGKHYDKQYNIFREAEYRSGTDVTYTPGTDRENYIAPMNNKIRLIQDNDSKQWVYMIPGDEVGNVLYTEWTTSGKDKRNRVSRYVGHGGEQFDKEKDYIFLPNGGLRHKKVNGKDRYFIGGVLKPKGQTDFNGYSGRGTITYEMEVQENDHVYGKKKEE